MSYLFTESPLKLFGALWECCLTLWNPLAQTNLSVTLWTETSTEGYIFKKMSWEIHPPIYFLYPLNQFIVTWALQPIPAHNNNKTGPENHDHQQLQKSFWVSLSSHSGLRFQASSEKWIIYRLVLVGSYYRTGSNFSWHHTKYLGIEIKADN